MPFCLPFLLFYILAILSFSLSFCVPTFLHFFISSASSSYLVHISPFFSTKMCFCVGVSGSLYCYIRGAPNYGIEERNVPRFFAGPGRDQYFIEGYLSLLFRCIVHYFPFLSYPFVFFHALLVILSLERCAEATKAYYVFFYLDILISPFSTFLSIFPFSISYLYFHM